MTIHQPYANLADMQQWARGIIDSRQPDFLIGPEADPYLRRWWVMPRNEWANVYLHEILHSDDNRAMHCHPWANTSFVIYGSYIEHTPEASFVRKAGDVMTRKATDLHRLEVVPGERAVTLFFTGPIERVWGFQTDSGWMRWQDYIAQFGER